VKRVAVNGVELAYLEEGRGPLVILTHGFPDTARTWDAVRPALAAAGYRAVTPNLRGYHPSGLDPEGRYDGETLGRDILGLIDALGEKSAIVVGHDFGAAASYAAAGMAPEKVRLLVTLAIPHPRAVKPSLGLLWRARHFIRFKLPGAVAALRRNDFALVDELVHRWSPAWQVPAGAFDDVKRSFANPGAAEAAIAMYQQISPRPTPALRARIPVPTVVFAGETDGALTDLAPYEAARARFTGSYEVVRMPGGHWLHLEHPDLFRDRLLDALRRTGGQT
jgi:pimeloyl-ACP methyl ester carboxylesterase